MRHWRGVQQPRGTDRKKKGFRKKLGGFVSDVRRIQVRMERGGQAVASGNGRYMKGSRKSDALDLACPTCLTSETMSVPPWPLCRAFTAITTLARAALAFRVVSSIAEFADKRQ